MRRDGTPVSLRATGGRARASSFIKTGSTTKASGVRERNTATACGQQLTAITTSGNGFKAKSMAKESTLLSTVHLS